MDLLKFGPWRAFDLGNLPGWPTNIPWGGTHTPGTPTKYHGPGENAETHWQLMND